MKKLPGTFDLAKKRHYGNDHNLVYDAFVLTVFFGSIFIDLQYFVKVFSIVIFNTKAQ